MSLATGSEVPTIYMAYTRELLTDLQRTRLSFGRMIRLLALPLPPSPVSNLSLFLGLPVCRRSSYLTEEGEGEGVGRRGDEKAWSFTYHLILSGIQKGPNTDGKGGGANIRTLLLATDRGWGIVYCTYTF